VILTSVSSCMVWPLSKVLKESIDSLGYPLLGISFYVFLYVRPDHGQTHFYAGYGSSIRHTRTLPYFRHYRGYTCVRAAGVVMRSPEVAQKDWVINDRKGKDRLPLCLPLMHVFWFESGVIYGCCCRTLLFLMN